MKQLITGFARIIIHKKFNGIQSFQEGRFKTGDQMDFGRFINMWQDSKFYDSDQSYTGWFPDAVNVGQGIALVDSRTVYAGEWKPSAGFPNEGMDLIYAGNLDEYKITSLLSRQGPV